MSGQPAADQGAGAGHGVRPDHRLTPTFAAPGGSGREPGPGPFADQVALELPERAEQVEDEAAARCGGVDRLGQRAEADALPLKSGDGLDQVRQRATEPVELPHRQHIALADVAQRPREARPVGPDSGGAVLEQLGASCRLERIAL